MKKFLSLLLACLMLVIPAGCSNSGDDSSSGATAESDYEYIKNKGTMVIAITEYEPMNYRDKTTGEWTGFDTEFAEAVAEKLGVTAEFKVIDWNNKEMELDARSVDCVWNGMTLTEEVKNAMSCTNPYVENAQVVVVKEENKDKYSTEDSLKDAKFAAESGSAGEKAIKEKYGDDNLIGVTAQSDALLEVQSGSADACVIDITMANSMIGDGTSYSDLVSTIKLTSEEYGIGFRKGSDMVEKVNEIMHDMLEAGELDVLAKQYGLTLIYDTLIYESSN